jgi:hypothetical protein
MIWFLEHQGLKWIKIEGGHAKYTRSDVRRPILLQTHITPVPELCEIIKNRRAKNT